MTRVEKRTERIDLELIRPEATLSWQADAHDLSLGFGAVLREHAEINSERRDGALQTLTARATPNRARNRSGGSTSALTTISPRIAALSLSTPLAGASATRSKL